MAAPTTTGLELHHHQLNHQQQLQQTPITTQQLPHSSHHAHLPQQQQHATTIQQPPHPQQHQHQCNCYLPVLKPDVLLNNDRGLFKVYCFIKDFIGASGTSAVAIDNKIEQAMDLVKSHLMIAVREEVEVLKERISELMVKINQLEVENTILKSNMSQETLQQLQMQTQLQIAGSTPTNGSNMITAAPTPAAITAAPQAAVQTAAPAANNTVMATPQSNMGSGTATPTATQQPNNPQLGSVDQGLEVTQQSANAATTEDNSQEAVQATNGPMS